jgi:hypothetical protein
VVSHCNRFSNTTGSSKGGSGSSFVFPSWRRRNVWCASSRVGPRSSPVEMRTWVDVRRHGACSVEIARLERGARRCAHLPSISERGVCRVCECRQGRICSELHSGLPSWRELHHLRAQHRDLDRHTKWPLFYGAARGPRHYPSMPSMARGPCRVDLVSEHHFHKNSSNDNHHRPLVQFPM